MSSPSTNPPPQGNSSTMATFMDLSAELRNHIYELSLVQPTPVRIGRAWSTELGNLDDYEFEAKNYPKCELTPNLLLVSRFVHAEATPVLYGANTFCIFACDVAIFLRSSRSNIKHMRQFRIFDINHHTEPGIASAFHSLTTLPALDSVRVAADQIKPGRLARLVAPWARELQAKRSLSYGDILDFFTDGKVKRSSRDWSMEPTTQESQIAWVKKFGEALNNCLSTDRKLRNR